MAMDTTNTPPCTELGPAPVQRTTTRDPALPSVEDFLSLIEDEDWKTDHGLSSYSVYHKYNKSC